jgi:hypothetical protein
MLLLVLARPLSAAPAAGDGKGDDPADPAAKVKTLNRTAMQYFDDLNYAMAEKTLLEALSVVEKSNLGGGPAGLSTHGNLAVLYSAGLKKPDKAVSHFKKALAVKPDLKLSKQRATPETEANMARARAELAGGSAGSIDQALKGGALPTLEARPSEGEAASNLKCPVVAEINAGAEIALSCATSGDLRPATVMLYYKANGGGQYQVVPMIKSSGPEGTANWAAKIPAGHTQAQRIPLYFEARDETGASLATSGEEDIPHVIAVRDAEAQAGGEAASSAETGVDDEADEEDDEGEEIDDNNPLARLEGERRKEHEGSKGTWWFSLGVGSGAGYAAGRSTEAFGKFGVSFSSGVAPAATGHLVPEIGYFIGRKTALSLAGRNQGVFGGPAGTATGAHSILLRALFFTERDEKIRWYFALAAGLGEGFRLQVAADVRNQNGDPTGMTVKDTVRGGPYLAGFGGGMLVKLSRHWRWSVDTQFLLGFGNISAVLDLTSGVRYQF